MSVKRTEKGETELAKSAADDLYESAARLAAEARSEPPGRREFLEGVKAGLLAAASLCGKPGAAEVIGEKIQSAQENKYKGKHAQGYVSGLKKAAREHPAAFGGAVKIKAAPKASPMECWGYRKSAGGAKADALKSGGVYEAVRELEGGLSKAVFTNAGGHKMFLLERQKAGVTETWSFKNDFNDYSAAVFARQFDEAQRGGVKKTNGTRKGR